MNRNTLLIGSGILCLVFYFCIWEPGYLSVAPETQKAFHSQLDNVKSRYEAADDGSIHGDAAASNIYEVQYKSNRTQGVPATDWIGKVESTTDITDSIYIKIEARVKGMTVVYQGSIRTESPLYAIVARLKEGDKVRFSGILGQEGSLMEHGAVFHPEFYLPFTNIELRN